MLWWGSSSGPEAAVGTVRSWVKPFAVWAITLLLALAIPSAAVVETAGEGFDELSLSVHLLDVLIVAETFETSEAATAFLELATLDLGSIGGGVTGALRYSVAMVSSSTGDAFEWTASLQVVPEPATGTFVLVGLAMLSRVRRRRAPRG